jgi:alpha-mannosidase
MFLVDEHNEQFINQTKLMNAATYFIALEPRSMLFSAFKKSDANDGYILRFYNLSRETRDAIITVNPDLGFTSVEEVKLDEVTSVQKHGVGMTDYVVTVQDVGHDEIVTLKFKV